ncbi:MAG: hypothetical protein K5769_07835 [Pseudobutyrivibrio sp.]|nr:hypothetical protein [Pseudobutyrivibrio sp.]
MLSKKSKNVLIALAITLSSVLVACGDAESDETKDAVVEQEANEIDATEEDIQEEANVIDATEEDIQSQSDDIDSATLKKDMASLYGDAKECNPSDFTGDWTSDNGDITVSTQDKSSLMFSGDFMYVTADGDTPDARTGSLEGEAFFINDNVAICKLEGDYVNSGEEAYVGFILNGDSLEVVESEGFSCPMMGADVTSEGTYTKK